MIHPLQRWRTRMRRSERQRFIILGLVRSLEEAQAETEKHIENASQFQSIILTAQKPMNTEDGDFYGKSMPWMDAYKGWYDAFVAPMKNEKPSAMPGVYLTRQETRP